VRMVLRAFMLMNVQKRGLHKRKRQHEVHQDGSEVPHTRIVSPQRLSLIRRADRETEKAL
jgi:hypothetical protein